MLVMHRIISRPKILVFYILIFTRKYTPLKSNQLNWVTFYYLFVLLKSIVTRGRGGWITRSRDQDHPGQHGETPSLLKIQKISWAWWHVPVIAATQEAEAGELPEPRRRRLQ